MGTTNELYHALVRAIHANDGLVTYDDPQCSGCGVKRRPGVWRHESDCKVWLQSMLQAVQAAVATLPGPVAPAPVYRTNNLPDGWRWMEPGEKVTADDAFFEDPDRDGRGVRLNLDAGYTVSDDRFDTGSKPGLHVGWCGYVRRLDTTS